MARDIRAARHLIAKYDAVLILQGAFYAHDAGAVDQSLVVMCTHAAMKRDGGWSRMAPGENVDKIRTGG